MAHPTIKIDTSVQATKRAHPGDQEEGLEGLDDPDQEFFGLEAGDNELIPPFLCQSGLGEFFISIFFYFFYFLVSLRPLTPPSPSPALVLLRWSSVFQPIPD